MEILAIAFWFANEGSSTALRKLIAGVVLFMMLGVFCELLFGDAKKLEVFDIKTLYSSCSTGKRGGGILAGSLAYWLLKNLETVGTVLVALLLATVSLILLTERSLLSHVKKGGDALRERSAADAEQRRYQSQLRREATRARRLEQEEIRARKDEERRLRKEQEEDEKILRMEKKVTGVMMDTSLKKPEQENRRDDIHEITYLDQDEYFEPEQVSTPVSEPIPARKVPQRTGHTYEFDTANIRIHKNGQSDMQMQDEPATPEVVTTHTQTPVQKPVATAPKKPVASEPVDINKEIGGGEKKVPKTYMFPPLSRLQKGTSGGGDSTQELKETAMRLQQTLHTFGVKVTITDISQGPSVTRYELQPEQGV